MTQANPLHRYAADGDAEAFAQIVSQYQRLVFATCRRRLHSPADVDDAMQETFLRLAQKAGELHSNLGGWLHSCAVNIATDINRRRSSRMRHEAAAARPADMGGEDQQTALAELREYVDAALQKICPDQRELIIQRYFVGRAQVELAAEAGVSPSVISNRLHDAVELLRGHLRAVGCGMGAVGGAALVASLLEAEHASAAVPAALTANIMKIGLSGATAGGTAVAGTLLTSLLVKVLVGLAAILLTGGCIWLLLDQGSSPVVQNAPTTTPSGPAAIVTGAGSNDDQTAQPPRWQTTQPSAQRAALAGRVLDKAGKPVAGATVTLNGPGYVSQPTARATTDAQGNYAFLSIRALGEYRVGVEADGFVPIEPFVSNDPAAQLTNASQARRDLVIERGVSVRVTVVNAGGAAVPNANIDANIRGERRGSMRRVTSDKAGQGKFVVPLSNSAYVVAASFSGLAPAYQIVTPKSVDEAQEVKLVLAPGLDIKGVALCSDGKPATGWEIVATPEWWASNYMLPGAPIDKDGNFTLSNVGAGNYTLDIFIRTANGGSSRPIGTVKLPPDHEPWRVSVPYPSPSSQTKISGIIRFMGGPSDSVSVEAVGLSDYRERRQGQVEFDRGEPGAPRLANNEARFSIDGLKPGTYRLTFNSSSIETKVIEKVEAPGEVPVVELKVVGRPHLVGTVVDAASGKPISHFAVRVRKLQTLGGGPNYVPDARWVQMSNPEGRFNVELIGPGVYQAQVSLDGYAWLWSPETRIEKGGVTADVTLKVTAGGSLRGLVVDSSGKAVQGAKVIPLSMARTVGVGFRERFESDAGAATSDAQGRFILTHLAGGDETIKVTHRDHAPAIVPKLRVIEGGTADAGSVALRVGGNVEGIVYDGDGKPSPGTKLQFLDDSAYQGGGDEEAGRLASVTTDEKGYFRVDHLPEQAIYASVAEGWQRQGVFRRTVRPVNGRTAAFDFGGTTPVKGLLLTGGQPRAGKRVELSVQSPHFGPVMVRASTDDEGRFAFFGPPPGRYTLYCESEARRGDWTAVRDVEFTGQPLDLGDVVYDLGDVVITIAADDPADAAAVQYVAVNSDIPGRAWQEPIASAGIDGTAKNTWRAKSVPAGHYRALTALKSGLGASFSVAFERKASAPETAITLRMPRASATLTIGLAKLANADPPAAQHLSLRSDDATIQSYVIFEKPEPHTLKLPPGTYRVLDQATGRPREDVEPILLAEGESRTVEISLVPTEPNVRTAVQLCIWSAEGILQTGATPRLLDADGKPAESTGNSGIGSLFILRPGHYRAMLDQPGRDAIIQEIDVPNASALPATERWLSVDILAR